MSANKYANLPDIDTSPDIYETDDVVFPPQVQKGNGSDDDLTSTRSTNRNGRSAADSTPSKEELDSTSLISTQDAARVFRKAERKHNRPRVVYTYPESPTSPTFLDSSTKSVPLTQRLRALQAELSALENELSDPSNPQLHKETVDGDVDPGDMIKGLSDVRNRLDKIKHRKEGRGRLMEAILSTESPSVKARTSTEDNQTAISTTNVIDIDKRIGQLEAIVGSSTTPLDEASPLPPPLLPLLARLNSQLTLLTQPRHIDSVSRRLKLLLSDLDRASSSQHHRRLPSQSGPTQTPSQMLEQMLPLLSRLGSSLPHIPHVLTRLRTLSALHASAAEFQTAMTGLEDEQKKTHRTLVDLDEALKAVNGNLELNRDVVGRNVESLENRVIELVQRLESLNEI